MQHRIHAELGRRAPAGAPWDSHLLCARVVSSVAQGFRISPALITGKGRTRTAAIARMAVYKILRDQHLSYPAIGTLLQRHHAAVIHGVARVERLFATDTRFSRRFAASVHALHLPTPA